MNLIGQRVRNVSKYGNKKFHGKEGEVVGGDEHNIIVKWDGSDETHEHDPYEILYTH
jgi:hypothetical protein